MICSNCGKENPDGVAFCSGCGTKLEAVNVQTEQPQVQPQPTVQVQPQVQPQPMPQQVVQPQPAPVYNVNIEQPQVSSEYKPISMWGYFGYELLFSIPCVGIICLIIMSFASHNINVKNFARSYFCYFIIVLVLCGIAAAILAATGGLAVLVDNLNL